MLEREPGEELGKLEGIDVIRLTLSEVDFETGMEVGGIVDTGGLEERGIEEAELRGSEVGLDGLRDEAPDELEGVGTLVEIDELIRVLLKLAEL